MSTIPCIGSDLVLTAVMLVVAAGILGALTIPTLLSHPVLVTVVVLFLLGAFTKP